MKKKNVKEIDVSGFETMASSIEFADNYNEWILNKFSPYIGGNLLEIGTGQGNFKKYLGKKVKLHVSVDIDKDVIMRARLRDPEGHYEYADIASPGFVKSLSSYDFQSIICINVLEHVPDHKSGLINLLDTLQTGGYLFLFVPAFKHLFNDLDQMAGHLRRYRKKDVAQLLKEYGSYEIITIEYFNPVGAFGWWLNKFKTHSQIDSSNINSQVVFFDRYLVPVSKLFNPLFKFFWGQSLFCIINKIK